MSTRERLGQGLAALLNRVITMDPEARRKLRRLEGRRVAVGLVGPGIEFSLAVSDGRFVFGPAGEIEADAWLRASPGAFLALAGSGGQAAAGQVELSGDTETARRFQQFFGELDPDFEEALSDLLGDVIGVQVYRFLDRGVRWARSASSRFAEDVGDYLRDESRQLVAVPEMERFLDEVDDLRDDVEHLARRVDRLTGSP